MKYDTIVKCNLRDVNVDYDKLDPYNEEENDKTLGYINCYLLTYKGCESDLEVELTSNFWFNTDYVATDRQEVAKINNTTELLDFMKENNIKYDKTRITKDLGVICGLNALIDKDLIFQGWED